MMPTAAVVNPRVDVYFGAGTLIHTDTLFRELTEIGFSGNLVIDSQAGIISDEIVELQRRDSRYTKIGSTLTGTGYASARRALRSLPLARDDLRLKQFCGDVSKTVQRRLMRDESILIEGHQGFGLSNYHGDYPYTSSRDSTASSMLAEVGLGPIQRRIRVVLATKMFPTRNHAGNLGDEMSVSDANALGIQEFGGGSWGIPNRRRRVAHFDLELVKRAIFANSATEIALTGVDYLYRNIAASSNFDLAEQELKDMLQMLENKSGVPVRYMSTSPDTLDMIDLLEERRLRDKARANYAAPSN
jgi:adenylosuccinate synthase